MSYKVFGTAIETSDMSSKPTLFQPVTPLQNKVIKSVRSTFVFYGDPTFDSLQMEIWKLKDGSLMEVIASSGERFKASILSNDFAVKSIYFEFQIYPSLRKQITYALALRINNYTGSESSHISWVMENNPFMDHETETIETVNIASSPFKLSIYGDRF